MIRTILIVILLFWGCRQKDTSSTDHEDSELITRIIERQNQILDGSSNIAIKNCNIAMKSYDEHISKIARLIKLNRDELNVIELNKALFGLHQSSLKLRDNLVLKSTGINYSCVKKDFVYPKTNVLAEQGYCAKETYVRASIFSPFKQTKYSHWTL